MSIFLSKFLPILAYPMGLACLLLLGALFLYRRLKWQRALLLHGVVAGVEVLLLALE